MESLRAVTGSRLKEVVKMEEVQRERTTSQWHRYSDIPSFKDKPKKSGEYIVTEVTTKNEIKVSIRYYDVINDLWGYRSGATKEENHIYGQVKAWMEKPEPWENK